jgi:DNA polymerase I-like protein with 3'-5' exonuclease and polymerase domains
VIQGFAAIFNTTKKQVAWKKQSLKIPAKMQKMTPPTRSEIHAHMKILFFDIETNGIDHWQTKAGLKDLHCLSIYEPSEDKMQSFSTTAGNVQEGLDLLSEADYICGHNSIKFDAPCLEKLYGFTHKNVLDTLVMAMCIYPDAKNDDFSRQDFPKDLIGRHSLKAWGYRIGQYKGDFGTTTDWSCWSQEMQDYCEQDVKVTYALFKHLTKNGPSRQMLFLEHDFAVLMQQQENNGWPFNIKKAEELTANLMAARGVLQQQLQEAFPPTFEEMKSSLGWEVEGIQGATKKELGVTLKELGKRPGEITSLLKLATKLDNKKKEVLFNPNSRDQISERLMGLGWKPTAFEGKRPAINEAVLREVGLPQADILCEYLLLAKRLGQVAEGKQAWLTLELNGRIHGEVVTGGAVSGRCTHRNPNIAQVPAGRAPFGHECRSCFEAPVGKVLVGADAAGLELRCLAHYLHQWDKGAYSKEIVAGDIHTANQRAAGLQTRDQAKTFIYAFLYGAGDAKIGSIVGGSSREGKKLKADFMRRIPAIGKLNDTVQLHVQRTNTLKGLDGRILPCRSPHSALNLLLQSAGAVLMKQALVTFSKKAAHPYELHGNIHDEVQFSCDPEHAADLGKTFIRSLRTAGEILNFKCPLDGEFKVGNNWAETH